MRSKLRSYRPRHTTVVAYLALFIALGGTSFAAVTLKRNSVRSAHIKNAQVKNPDLGADAVDSAKVGDGKLLAQDFAPGQLPQGQKGDTGGTGERGEQGQRGAQGPGAAKVVHSAPGTGANTDVATAGPWTISASCTTVTVAGVTTTRLDVSARGPGGAEWAGMTAPNDGTPTPDTGAAPLNPATNTLMVSAGAPAAEFNRLAFDFQLHSASEAATVSVNGLADRRGGGQGACTLYGTAVPAS